MEDAEEAAGVVDGLAVPDDLLVVAALVVVRPRGLVLCDAVLVRLRRGEDENERERGPRDGAQESEVFQG